MTKNGYVKQIGRNRDAQNRLHKQMKSLRVSSDRWAELNEQASALFEIQQDTVQAAIAAGTPKERIRAITYREYHTA